MLAKYCPKCGRNYTDDLTFCLEDGSLLVSSVPEQSFPYQTQATVFSTAGIEKVTTPKKKGTLKIILLITGGIFLLLFGGLSLALLLYFSSMRLTSNTNPASVANTNSASNLYVPNVSSVNTQQANASNKNVQIAEDFSSDEEGLREDTSEQLNSSDESADSEIQKEVADKPKEEKGTLTGTYSGALRNQTVGGSGGVTFRLIQEGYSISGRVIIAEPFVGSGSIISGAFDGDKVYFVSYNAEYDLTIYWEGKVRGKSISGTYTAATSNPNLYPNTQYGTWSVKKK
ncbi:MAG: hypothetical protein N2Z23_00215 [Pyrinomonadaceae bacterium]|nr:hypothetical protein [Pyrinomonadaceae bacterium]MCX7638857.1 hypothetical protein [Pyrinomonadaceae bacterium]MDW8305007.1 hypothetical protein [Acidobacteriota bacterium]